MSNIIMFCKPNFLAIIPRHNSGTEVEAVTIFHIWSDTESLMRVSDDDFETVVTV